MKESLQVIKQEHRNLFRVVNVLDQMMRHMTDGTPVDFGFFSEVLSYIETFTDVYHHPKEDRYLFKALLNRDPSAQAIIEELELEHVNCPASLERLQEKLATWQAAPLDPEAREGFRQGVADYLRFQTKHLQKEEGVVIPLAQRALLPEDWEAIDVAFRDNADPVFGPQARAEARSLYSRIVNAAPAPFGFGD